MIHGLPDWMLATAIGCLLWWMLYNVVESIRPGEGGRLIGVTIVAGVMGMLTTAMVWCAWQLPPPASWVFYGLAAVMGSGGLVGIFLCFRQELPPSGGGASYGE